MNQQGRFLLIYWKQQFDPKSPKQQSRECPWWILLQLLGLLECTSCGVCMLKQKGCSWAWAFSSPCSQLPSPWSMHSPLVLHWWQLFFRCRSEQQLVFALQNTKRSLMHQSKIWSEYNLCSSQQIRICLTIRKGSNGREQSSIEKSSIGIKTVYVL